jgi:hypothetical protein
MRHLKCAIGASKQRVRKRNNRARKARNLRGNLAIQENVARIQAAGGYGFVKRLRQFATPNDEAGTACEDVEAP